MYEKRLSHLGIYVNNYTSAGPKKLLSYSTVTLFARFLGWSTSQPRSTAM
jgi:hypothetical protein